MDGCKSRFILNGNSAIQAIQATASLHLASQPICEGFTNACEKNNHVQVPCPFLVPWETTEPKVVSFSLSYPVISALKASVFSMLSRHLK